MAKFSKKDSAKTANYMGGVAFKQKPKTELAHAVLTTFVESSYYEDENKRTARIAALIKEIAKTDPVFVAKLAIYARDKFNMRSAFHVAVGELAKVYRGDNLVSRLIEKGTIRVDDLIEIVAYVGKKPIPNQVKKGVAAALNKFDAYQLAKYRREGHKFSLVDLFNLVHPKPLPQNVDAWKKLIAGELTQTGETWEARLSAGEDAKIVWRDMLKTGKLPYMACLRNLRNILKTNDAETIALAASFIRDQKQVAKSRQLPFRFLSAYRELAEFQENGGDGIVFEKDAKPYSLIDAVRQALEYSVANIPLLAGQTMILSDNSGSMRGDGGGSSSLSRKSKRTTADIANLFAVLYWSRAENTYVGLFGDRLISPQLDRAKTIFENFDVINVSADTCGSGTETGIFDAFEVLLKNGQKPNRIVIFSDCQVGTKCKWYDAGDRKANDFNALFQKFRAFSPETIVYSVDLKSYGNTLFAGGVIELAGWSDRIFHLMDIAERDKHAFIHEIESIEI